MTKLEQLRNEMNRAAAAYYALYSKEKLEKQDNCKTHDFRYEGHGHNDDCYECRKCGFIEWR